MAAERQYLDITDLPDLARAAEQVRMSGRPTVLRRGTEEIAMIVPVEATAQAKRRRARGQAAQGDNQWLVDLIGIGADEEPPDGPTDVSANKYKYLADAKLGKSRPPATQ